MSENKSESGKWVPSDFTNSASWTGLFSFGSTADPLSYVGVTLPKIIYKFPKYARLIFDEPILLDIFNENKEWLNLSKSSFNFWDNEDDAAYDNL